MTWIVAILLAVAAFGVAVVLLKLPRPAWTALAAALVLGLAGYAMQANPDIPSAPKATVQDSGEAGWEMVKAREVFIGIENRSGSSFTTLGDGQARAGRFADAVTFYEGAAEADPKDVDAWLGLANALVEHADGTLSPAALHAYRRAAQAQPGGVGSGYFLGLALLREGSVIEGRDIWATTLENADENALGRDVLAGRLAQLNAVIEQVDKASTDAPVNDPAAAPSGTVR